MTEHLSKPRLERLCVRALSSRELVLSTQHLATCRYCRRHYQTTREAQRGGSTVRFTLAPEVWLRHEHLDYEQLVALAEQATDAEDQELINLHLKICAVCREDMRSFLAFREQIKAELLISYAPTKRRAAEERKRFAWWTGLQWQFRYAAVILLVVIGVVTGLLLFNSPALDERRTATPAIKPGANNQLASPEARATNSTANPERPTPAHDGHQAGGVTTRGNRGPIAQGKTTTSISLRDADRTVTISDRGIVSGLDDIPASSRRAVAAALQTEAVARSAIMEQLAEGRSTLRGRGVNESFSLISPSETVIVGDRPVFKWQPLAGARSYRVYVTDSNGKVDVKSGPIEPTITQWNVSYPLKRGEVYSWAVVALRDDEEIVSPGPAASEVRFQILSAADLDQLNQLRKSNSHLALGVFYARVGLISEAESEFAELASLNPHSKLPKQLLRSLRRQN